MPFRYFPPFLAPAPQIGPRLLSLLLPIGTLIFAMDAEIKAEFEKSGFSFQEEEQILQKCNA